MKTVEEKIEELWVLAEGVRSMRSLQGHGVRSKEYYFERQLRVNRDFIREHVMRNRKMLQRIPPKEDLVESVDAIFNFKDPLFVVRVETGFGGAKYFQFLYYGEDLF